MPCLARPRRAGPGHTMPRPAKLSKSLANFPKLTSLALPYHAMPRLASPYVAAPHQAALRLATIFYTFKISALLETDFPCLTLPCQATQRPAAPRHALPSPAMNKSLLLHTAAVALVRLTLMLQEMPGLATLQIGDTLH